jgi:hypothetical protein
MNAEETKTCSKCGVEKPLEEFPMRSDSPTRRGHCKQCHSKLSAEVNRRRLLRNPEHVRAVANAYAAKHREKRAAHARTDYAKHREARCLYCGCQVAPGTAHIDYFIPWSRYPIDLGHNFVLAHAGYNSAKAGHLAASELLGRWVKRNRRAAAFLQEQFDQGLVVHSARRSERIARWAYSKAAATRALAWVRDREFQPIDESCVHLLA